MQEKDQSNFPIKEVSLGAGLLTVSTFGLYHLYKRFNNPKKNNTENTKKDDISSNNKKGSESKVTLYFTTLNEQSRSIWHYCLLNDVDVAVDLLEYNTEKLEKVNPFKNGIILKDGDFFLTEAPAIARYLSEKEGKVSEWFGDNKETRSLVDQYMSWHQRNLGFCSQLWKDRIQENLKENGESTQLTNEGTEQLISSLDVIENIFLKDSLYLCGVRPTFADILACHQIWQLTTFKGTFGVKVGEKTKQWLAKLEKMLFTDQVLAELREFAESEKVLRLRNDLQLCDTYSLSSISQLHFYQKGLLNKNCLFRPVVICGPSGAGKSTLIGLITKKFPEVFTFSVSHTTRKMREGEKNGVNYHYVSREEFLKLQEQKIFIENAEYSGNLYGTSYTTLHDAKKNGKICLLDIDLQGVQTIKSVWNKDNGPMPAFIQIVPPNFQELKKRLVGRGTDSEEVVNRRLDIALGELKYTHVPEFFDHVIINEDKDLAYLKLTQAINECQFIKN